MIPSASEYAVGTANWNRVAQSQGVAAANAQWQAAIDAERNQTPLDTSVWSIFGKQIATDPLAAPFDSANTAIGNSFLSFLKNPWVVAAVVVIVFSAMGGFAWLGRKVFSK